jgi:hypothetical protein
MVAIHTGSISQWHGALVAETVADYGNNTQHFHHLGKTGVGQDTFETRKMRDL